MTAYSEAKDKGGFFISVIWIVVIFSCLVFYALTATKVQNPLSMNSADFIRNQCKQNSFFAEATDYEGNVVHFCMLENGNIGVLKFYNGKFVDAETLNSDINLRDLIDYIHSIDENFRLVRFDSGFIKAP